MSTRRKTTSTTQTKSTTSRSKSRKSPVSRTSKTTSKVAKSSGAPKPASAASQPASSATKATVVTEKAPTTTAPMMKKKELLDLVVERSGVRKKFAKPTVEAMMAVLGEAIAEGRDLNLPPMGKIKQQRTKDAPNVRVTVAKIRQSKSDAEVKRNSGESGEEKPNLGVAEAAE